MKYAKKTALITGASSGLGLDLAKNFARDGHNVVLVARRLARLQEIAQDLTAAHAGVKVHVIDHDLGQPGAGKKLFEKVKGLGLEIDFLVNNAGVGTNGEFISLPLEKELQMMDLNIRSLVELTHLFLPAMIHRGFGRILNVGSTAAFQPGPYMTTYYASKAFVNSFSEGLHEELRGSGVTCTVLAPGATATDFAQAAKMEKSALFNTPLVASSEKVAQAGYRAMLRGQALKIPGCSNQLLVQSIRLLPRALVRKLAGIANGKGV